MAKREKFKFPKTYMEMDINGFFRNNDCNYLWLYDMEWIECKDIFNYEYYDEIDSLVPFAHTGGGDIWGWNIDEKYELPIVFCPHDDEIGYYYAPSFEASLFRQILDFVSHANFYINNPKTWQKNDEEAKKIILNWNNKLNKYFRKEWVLEIEKILSLDLKYYTYPKGEYYLYITPDEKNEIVNKYLKFDLLNKEFKWCL